MNRNLKNVFLIATFCAVISGCTFLSGIFSKSPLTQGDLQVFKTIGPEFVEYSAKDSGVTTDTLVQRQKIVADWGENGSTWITYKSIVGEDNNGPYVIYFSEDPKFDPSDKKAREYLIDSWEINLRERLGEKSEVK